MVERHKRRNIVLVLTPMARITIIFITTTTIIIIITIIIIAIITIALITKGLPGDFLNR